LWIDYHCSLNYELIVVFLLSLEFWVSRWNALEITKGFFFPFYLWEVKKEKFFHFVNWHNKGVEHLLPIAMLTTNEKAYTLVYKAY
jgi:hypothetical protein